MAKSSRCSAVGALANILAAGLLLAPPAHAAAPRTPAELERAAALFLAQDYGRAHEAFAQVARTGGVWAEPARRYRARCLADLGRWDECLAAVDGLGPASGAWKPLLAAEALQALGRPEEAAGQYVSACAAAQGGPLAALAWYRAGFFAAAQGDAEGAEAALKAAQKRDNSYTRVHRLLADIYSQTGRVSDAKQRLERARRTDPRDEVAREELNQLVEEHPELERRDRRARKAGLALRMGEPNPAAARIPWAQGSPPVRVGLLRAERFKFKLGPAMEAFAASEEPRPGCGRFFLPAGSTWQARRAKGRWELRRLDGGAGRRRIALREALRLAPTDEGGTFRIFEVAYGSGYFFAGEEDRAYRGDLELAPEGGLVTAVNVLPLEAWLCGVVPAEIPASWPAEALKAQAVVARTDGLSKMGRHRKAGFDVCPEVHCAAYRGVTGEDPRAIEAVRATRGLVLVQPGNGRLVQTVYMNSCGGRTWSGREAWSGVATPAGGVSDLRLPAPPPDSAWALLDWLDNTPDAWCHEPSSPAAHTRWVLAYPAAELTQMVCRSHPDVGTLSRVEPALRQPSGYVRALKLTGDGGTATVRGDGVRAAVRNLRSNLFYVETRYDGRGQPVEFLFHGGGWGHGVGFCQQGAAGRARAGQGARAIIGAYFPEASIELRY